MPFVEREYEVEIPKGSGRPGFLKAIDTILKLPRVRSIHVDSNGKITCARMVEESDPFSSDIGVNFETMTPYAIVRNRSIVELAVEPDDSPDLILFRLFKMAEMRQLSPIAIVTGPNTELAAWLTGRANEFEKMENSQFFGLPVFRDRAVEDNVMLLCAGYDRGGSLPDTQMAFKIVLWRSGP